MSMTQRQDIFTLMGGRVNMLRGRYNPTSDAVWLAASVATDAKTVLDVGVGTGGVALCVLTNNPGAVVAGIDNSSEMLDECRKNADLNRRDIELINADVITWKTDRTFDAVVTNPPYFKGTPAVHNAHHNADIPAWVRACVRRVRPRGRFYIIIDAAVMADVVSAMQTVCGDINVLPLFGAKNMAERVLVWGRAGTRGATVIHRGVPMNSGAILRDGLTVSAFLSRLNQK